MRALDLSRYRKCQHFTLFYSLLCSLIRELTSCTRFARAGVSLCVRVRYPCFSVSRRKHVFSYFILRPENRDEFPGRRTLVRENTYLLESLVDLRPYIFKRRVRKESTPGNGSSTFARLIIYVLLE